MTCPRCASQAFEQDEEGDLRCLVCSRVAIRRAPVVASVPAGWRSTRVKRGRSIRSGG